MGQEHVETRSATSTRIPQSYIPVITPRPSLSSLPSSLSTPHLGLVPPSRLPTVSASPAPPTGQNASAPGVAGGLVQLRSFRNLLSFGASKNHGTPSTGGTRPFAGLRRSPHAEYNTPNPPSREKSQDLPVLSIEMSHTIELSHRVDEPLIDSEDLQKKLGLRPPTPETVSLISSTATSISTTDLPTTPLGISELSTIIEADTSGISHTLQFDDSRDEAELSLSFTNSGRTVKPAASGPLLRSGSVEEPGSLQPLNEKTLQLDLSSSKVSNDVLAALAAPNNSKGWLDTLIVDDKPQSHTEHEGAMDPDVSFNLGAVDPDLAALLSPNRISNSTQTSPASSLRCTPPPSPRAPEPDLSSKARASPSASRLPDVPPPIPLISAYRSASLARPSTSNLGTSSVPRLARSASERPQSRAEKSPVPSPTRSQISERGTSSAGHPRSSLQIRRASAAAESRSRLPRRSTSADRDDKPRMSVVSRLVTPSRHLTALAVGRATLRHPDSAPSTPNHEVDYAISARAGPNIGSSTSGHSVPPQHISLDHTASKKTQSHLGLRERSASLTESTPYHPAVGRPADWLGPRTARAFAAAGLLNQERLGSSIAGASRPGSRFGTTRSERDIRSQYAPSRMAFSEVGTRSPRSRRSDSISRTVASSDVLSSHGAESASAPRTAFSAASTAPTSVSAASSAQKHLQTELQLLQDRHALETGALLNALADSQRTTRILREENTQLRDQIQQLEDRLADTLDELCRIQFAPPPKLQRNNFYRASSSLSESTRRTLPSRLQTMVIPDPEPEEPEDIEETSQHHQRTAYDTMLSSTLSHTTDDSYQCIHNRRHSMSSSIFPILPSNMTMLLHEGVPEHDTGRSTRSTSPSFTMPGAPVPSGQNDWPYDTHRRKLSTGNISTTTASFSIITGSPATLALRPEHEKLLGDMPMLDLCAKDHE